jgi:hypothetical protein
MAQNKSMENKNAAIELALLTKLGWNDLPPVDVVEVGPPEGGSFFEVPGPKRRPVRPHLEPFAGAGGVAARLLRGDGVVIPVAVLPGPPLKLVPLSAPPVALSARSDGGLWILTQSALEHLDANGRRLLALDLTGLSLVGTSSDDVWVVGHDDLWFVQANGQSPTRLSQNAGFGWVGSGASICAIEKNDPRYVRCVEPNGTEQRSRLSAEPDPFAQLLLFKEGEVITRSGSVIRHYYPDGKTGEISVQAAGLTAAGEVFVSGREKSFVKLWLAGELLQFPLPPEVTSKDPFRVVSVENNRALVLGFDLAAYYEDEQVKKTFVVDDSNYGDEVFPKLWNLGGSGFTTAFPDGRVLISASGPSGVALITLRFIPAV